MFFPVRADELGVFSFSKMFKLPSAKPCNFSREETRDSYQIFSKTSLSQFLSISLFCDKNPLVSLRLFTRGGSIVSLFLVRAPLSGLGGRDPPICLDYVIDDLDRPLIDKSFRALDHCRSALSMLALKR